MKEVKFLHQNVKKWKQFEKLLYKSRHVSPDKLADLFIQITDDLSYARTYYPESQTTVYLNQLALQAHQLIYKNKKEKGSRIATFWRDEVPLTLLATRRYLLYSFLIFTISILIGIISSINDESFIRVIMGDYYVEMTISNIESGDPMAVYKQANEMNMFLGITINNIQVSFLAFVLGILVSVGTGYVLFSNGVMVGSFHAFMAEYGELREALLTIWIHGTLEIWAIVVAGASGLVIGHSILFPETYSRRASFRRAMKKAVKLIVSLIPVFITAGFLEGFVTRHTEAPVIVRLGIILGSLVFIVWYFFIYPEKVYVRTHQAQPDDKQLFITKFLSQLKTKRNAKQ